MNKPDLNNLSRMFGIELEFFLLDEEGKIRHDADRIIKSLRSRLRDSEIKEECAHSMLELTSFPHLSSRHVFKNFFGDLEDFLYEINDQEMNLTYHGCYPGKNEPRFRKEARYESKENILGKENFLNAGRCVGFHYHYSLPRRTFNPRINFFYPDINQRKKNKVLNIYNLFIALDPALSTLMQSSPYYQNEHIGKDSRMIVYRGEELFKTPSSLYARHPEFGVLNKYSSDFRSLESETRDRYKKWNSLLKDHGYSFSSFKKKTSSILDSSWKPVKISPHGTIESRGSDMNSPRAVVAVSLLLKSLTRYVTSNKISVVPGELGNKEPFTSEDGKLHVPTFAHLKNELQYNAATQGFEDKDVHRYTKKALQLGLMTLDKEQRGSQSVFSEMIEEKKTVSDNIIDFVKKRQGRDSYKIILEETARESALRSSEELFKDLFITKKFCERTVC